MLVQAVPCEHYTPRREAVAGQVAMGNADIGGLCPIADVGESLSRDALWSMARAMCAGLSGDTSLAAPLTDRARQPQPLAIADLLLVERIAGTATGSQRNPNSDWTEANRLHISPYALAQASVGNIPARPARRAGPR